MVNTMNTQYYGMMVINALNWAVVGYCAKVLIFQVFMGSSSVLVLIRGNRRSKLK